MTTTISALTIPDPIQVLTRDLKAAAATLTATEARYLVDYYYTMQENRKRADNQVRALGEAVEPHSIILWLATNTDTLERNIRSALLSYSTHNPVGAWAMSIRGIGPVIAAGLLAHIDITKAPTVGHIWRFAGLDPTVKWAKGQKRPWNAQLKTLCWKIGESFVKQSGNMDSLYSRVYKERKQLETELNEAGAFKDQAAISLQTRNFSRDTVARKYYEEGKLPPARIHLRAQRYTVKLFLAHLHCVWYYVEYNRLPPKPYVLEHLGHAHFIFPPNVDLVPGLREALASQGTKAKFKDAKEISGIYDITGGLDASEYVNRMRDA